MADQEPWESDDRDYDNPSDGDVARWAEEDETYMETHSPWNKNEEEGLHLKDD